MVESTLSKPNYLNLAEKRRKMTSWDSFALI